MTKKTESAATSALKAAHEHIRISEVYLLSGREHQRTLRCRFGRAVDAATEALATAKISIDDLCPDDRGLIQSIEWAGTNPANGPYFDQAVKASARLADALAVR